MDILESKKDGDKPGVDEREGALEGEVGEEEKEGGHGGGGVGQSCTCM